MQSLPKSLFIFVFCVPLAIVLGVMLATPLDRTTLLVILGGFLLLLTPLLLTSHHTFLILSWNAFVNVFFLPGKPYIWILAVGLSAFFLVLTNTLNRGKIQLITVPSISWPIIMIGVVTFVTAQLTGGVGSQALGSDVFGGKRYIFLWASLLGYFVLSALPVEASRRQSLAGLFFLSSVTAALSNLAYTLGDNFYFLFLLFPVEWALPQAASEFIVGGFSRIGGLGPASVAIVSFFLIRYGLRGTFNIRYPWRMVTFVGGIAAGLFSGFRATFLLAVMLFTIQFFAEGLHRTKYLLIGILGGGLLAAGLLPVADRLPLSVQRCLTILPVKLDQAAVDTARGSNEWRLEMWRAVIPDIPMYFWKGKGYAIDPKDLYFSQQSISLRAIAPYEASLVAGDYHNGPLTLIIPFGIWGVLAFGWFCIASLRLLWRNYKYGEEEIRNINRFLLVAFITQLLFFIFIFGAFYLDLVKFIGLVGLSVSMNRGMASPGFVPAVAQAEPEPELEPVPPPAWQPAFRRRLEA